MHDIIFKAGSHINVAMLKHHSADGRPQCGYHGSGPADTALSILAAALPAATGTSEQLERSPYRPVTIRNGVTVSWLAWELHQDFKRDMLAPLDPEQEHCLKAADIALWLERNTPERAS